MKPRIVRIIFYITLGFVPLIVHSTIPKSYYAGTELGIINIFASPIYWGFAIIGFLGFRLNQSRILLTSILFASSYFLNLNHDFFLDVGIGRIRMRQILCVTLPLSLTLFFSVRESRFWNKRSLFKVVLAALPLITMGCWFLLDPKSFHNFATLEFLPIGQFHFYVPQLAFLSALVYLYTTVNARDKRIHFFRTSTLITLLPFFAAQHIGMKLSVKGTDLTFFIILSYAIICGIMLHALLTMYWERVYIDELTDIPNRRALDEKLETLEGQYSIAMIDIDHFKKFNDTFGHIEGDNVLRLVAQVIQKECGSQAYRFGGEEFCILMEDTNCYEGGEIAERVREEVESRNFYLRSPQRKRRKPPKWKTKMRPLKSRKPIQVTVSIGVASPDGERMRTDDVFKAADKALYKAKDLGRNQVVVDEEILLTSSNHAPITESDLAAV